MRFDDVVIASLVGVEAPERVTTADLEARLAPHFGRLGLLKGTLEALSGIRARRFWPAGTRPSDAAAAAALAGGVLLVGFLLALGLFFPWLTATPEEMRRHGEELPEGDEASSLLGGDS